MTAALKILAAMAWSFCVAAAASAQESSHQIVRKSLVHLSASGVAMTGPNATQPNSAQSQGTGFFVSDDGFILSTRHFLAPLEKVSAEQVQITAGIGDASATRIPVKFVSELPRLDLVLLRAQIPFGVDPPPALVIGDSAEINPASPPVLLNSGFSGNNYLSHTATLNDTVSADIPYGITLDVQINSGESGSPVYIATADSVKVVGVLKGSSSQVPALTIMVPIEYSLPLIGYLQMRLLQQRVDWLVGQVGETSDDRPPLSSRMAEVEDNVQQIGNYFNWSAETRSDDGSLRIRYEKIMGGAPQVEQIDINLTPNIRRSTGAGDNTVSIGPGTPLKLNDTPKNTVMRSTLDPTERVGEFLIDGVQERLETLVALTQGAIATEPVRDLEIIIVPSVGGIPLEPRKLIVVADYEWE